MAGVLTAIGGISIGASADKPRRLFAAIPLGFAAQQAAEGIVWLTIDNPAHATLHRAAVKIGCFGVSPAFDALLRKKPPGLR